MKVSFFTPIYFDRRVEEVVFLRSEYWPMFDLDISSFRNSRDRIKDFPAMRDWARSEREEMWSFEQLLGIQDYARISNFLNAVRTSNIFRFNLNHFVKAI